MGESEQEEEERGRRKEEKKDKQKRRKKKKSAEEFRPFNKDKCLTFISEPCAHRKLPCLPATQQDVANVVDDKKEKTKTKDKTRNTHINKVTNL